MTHTRKNRKSVRVKWISKFQQEEIINQASLRYRTYFKIDLPSPYLRSNQHICDIYKWVVLEKERLCRTAVHGKLLHKETVEAKSQSAYKEKAIYNKAVILFF